MHVIILTDSTTQGGCAVEPKKKKIAGMAIVVLGEIKFAIRTKGHVGSEVSGNVQAGKNLLAAVGQKCNDIHSASIHMYISIYVCISLCLCLYV